MLGIFGISENIAKDSRVRVTAQPGKTGNYYLGRDYHTDSVQIVTLSVPIGVDSPNATKFIAIKNAFSWPRAD